jgi:hypothetical protein
MFMTKSLIFDFVGYGQPFSKTSYLDDGIYLYLTQFLPTEPDPTKKLKSCFTVDQEAARERLCCCEEKVQALTHPINHPL